MKSFGLHLNLIIYSESTDGERSNQKAKVISLVFYIESWIGTSSSWIPSKLEITKCFSSSHPSQYRT